MAYLFRIYNSYLGANILMYDKMDESEYPYFFVTTVFYNGMMTNKGIYQMPIMNGETTGQYGLPVELVAQADMPCLIKVRLVALLG